jgi:hypothetical protein
MDAETDSGAVGSRNIIVSTPPRHLIVALSTPADTTIDPPMSAKATIAHSTLATDRGMLFLSETNTLERI